MSELAKIDAAAASIESLKTLEAQPTTQTHGRRRTKPVPAPNPNYDTEARARRRKEISDALKSGEPMSVIAAKLGFSGKASLSVSVSRLRGIYGETMFPYRN